MRIITEPFLKAMAAAHPQAAAWLETFITLARAAQWKNLVEVRRQYPHADAATVVSRRKVIIFNVAGNKFRLIAAIHFRTALIFTLRFLTHAEYSKDTWKNDL